MVKSTFTKLNSPRIWDTAVLVKDLEKVKQRFETFGLGQIIHPLAPVGAEGLFFNGKPFVTDFKAFLVQIGNMQMEFIQPDSNPNPWSEFLQMKGEGFHHIGLQVADVEKEVARLTALGAEVPFYGKANGKIAAAYVDLKTANLFIELTGFCSIDQASSGIPVLPRVWDAAVVVNDIEKTRQHLEKMGFGPFVKPGVPAGAEGLYYRGQPLSSNSQALTSWIGNLHLELIQPGPQPNPWIDFLNHKGEGIHHLGYQVKDVEQELNRLTSLGAEASLIGKANGKIEAVYVDLKVASLVIELTGFGPA